MEGQNEQNDIEHNAQPRGKKFKVFVAQSVQEHTAGEHMQNAELYHILCADREIGDKRHDERYQHQLDASFQIRVTQITGNAGNNNKDARKIRFGRCKKVNQPHTPLIAEKVAEGIEGMKENHTENSDTSQFVQCMNTGSFLDFGLFGGGFCGFCIVAVFFCHT